MKYTPPLDSTNPNAGYVNADPANGQEGSIIPAGALEDPQREIIAVITDAGLTPSPTDKTQLKQAINTKINGIMGQVNSAIGAYFASDTQVSEGKLTNKTASVAQLDQKLFATLDADRLYEGVNLQTKFASEISTYANVWAWIQARIQAGNFKGIHVGDFIPLSTKAGTVGADSVGALNMNARIVGINTYKNAADQTIGNHIDFITKECVPTEVKWNPTDNNNGTSAENHPWLASAVYAWLNGVNNYSTAAYQNLAHGLNAANKGMFQRLPAALQNVIIPKRTILDSRYSASAHLIGGTGWDWSDMGKLWLPNEIEVYGHQVRSNLCQTQGWWNPEAGLSVQYPWFASSVNHRILNVVGGGRTTWWLSSAASSYAGHACSVRHDGIAYSLLCTYAGIRVPLCFRIG